MRLPALVTLLCLPVALAVAQGSGEAVRLYPGHPDLATGELTLEPAYALVRQEGAFDRDLGVLIDEVRREGDTVTVRRVIEGFLTSGVATERVVSFVAGSLAPVSLRQSDVSGSGAARYDGRRVRGEHADAGATPLPFDVALDDVPFAPATLEIVARALPLRPGYAAAVPTFSPDDRLGLDSLVVVGEGTFARADGSTADAWVVRHVRDNGRDRTYYVDPTTRDLIGSTVSTRSSTVVSEAVAGAPPGPRPRAAALRPGADVLVVGALSDGSVDFSYNLVDPFGQEGIATQTRRLSIDPDGRTATLTVETATPTAGVRAVDTVVVAFPSLRPLSSAVEADGTARTLTYAERGVTGSIAPPDGGPTAVDVAFDEPVFDQAWWPEVARLLPFEEGYRVTVPAFGRDGESAVDVAVEDVTMEVEGRRRVGDCDAWTVRMQQASGAQTLFHVDAETRALCRMDVNGEPGVVVHVVPTPAGGEGR